MGTGPLTEPQRRKLRQAYEGTAFGDTLSPGEVGYSPYLARAYPTLDTLLADGEFFAWSEALYAPLLACLGNTAGDRDRPAAGAGPRRGAGRTTRRQSPA